MNDHKITFSNLETSLVHMVLVVRGCVTLDAFKTHLYVSSQNENSISGSKCVLNVYFPPLNKNICISLKTSKVGIQALSSIDMGSSSTNSIAATGFHYDVWNCNHLENERNYIPDADA